MKVFSPDLTWVVLTAAQGGLAIDPSSGKIAVGGSETGTVNLL